MLGPCREVPFLFSFILLIHSSLILSTPSGNYTCKITQWLSSFPTTTHTILLDPLLSNMSKNVYVAFIRFKPATNNFGLMEPNPMFVELVQTWQSMGIQGVVVTDGIYDPGQFAWSNVLKFFFPSNLTIPIGIVNPNCIKEIGAFPNGLNATVEGWDPNGWVDFVLSPAYVFWSVSLAFLYTVNMAIASYKLVEGCIFYRGVEINIAFICLTMELCANFLRMIQMVFVPLLNRWRIQYATIMQTVAQPFTISSSILLIFFWLDLTSGSLYQGSLLSVMRYPAMVAIICIFSTEIIIDVFRCIGGSDNNSTEALVIVYASIHALTAVFYFYAAAKLFRTGNELSNGKSNSLKSITVQVVCCGVSIFCTLVMVLCLVGESIQTTPAGTFTILYLLWFSFVPQSMLQITVFGNQKARREKAPSVGKSDSIPIHKTDSEDSSDK